MDVLQSGLFSDFTWSHSHVFAGGTSQVFLLIEWRAGVLKQKTQFHGFNQCMAEDVQLHLQLGERVQVERMYGCQGEILNDRNISLSLGSLSEGRSKQLVLELSVGARQSGVYPIITALWTYMDVQKRKVVLQPSRTIPLQFSNHTALKYRRADYRVEKVLKLYQNASILEQAIGKLERGKLAQGEEMIRRQADEMLLYAIRFRDADYLKEAETLYQLIGLYLDTYRQLSSENANRKRDFRLKN
ncbi:hypothetical protein MKY48_07585 [Paenibacillus sp. FSL W8-0187]|uniref:hypothetical protein n=1 Tax=unclassified Paenibacillus TaxID=185978 RepID=UPI0030D786FC